MELSDLVGKYEIIKHKGSKQLKFICSNIDINISNDFIIPNDNYIEAVS